MFTLRQYQQRAIDALWDWFLENASGNPLMILPTAAGKSVILAALVHDIMSKWPNTRVLMLTHVKELIAQNFEKLEALCPGIDCGIYSAGIGRKDKHAQVLFAGIQSIASKAIQIGWVDIIFIDEAHLVPQRGNGRYRKFIAAMQRINPNVRIVGLTATPFRLDSGYLHQGDDRIFTDVACNVSVLELLECGYLSPLVSKSTGIQIDTSAVKKTGGDYNIAGLESAIADQNIIERSINDAIVRAAERKHWLIFTPSVKSAHHISDFLWGEHGIQCPVLDGETPKKERDQIVERYKAGEYRALVNCAVLTTGFDAPIIDCIINLRPTQSTALYIQMMGRGMRLADDKEDCLVLDYAGNIQRHGCIDDPQIMSPRSGDGTGTAPTKACPECESIMAAGKRECVDCGFQFPEPKPQLQDRPDDQAIISTQHKSVRQHVGFAQYTRHSKQGSPDSLKVTYYGLGMLPQPICSEWVCLEHEGFARQKAGQWWLSNHGHAPIPKTVGEALARQDELVAPGSITTLKHGKYLKITKREFENERQAV